MNCSCLTSRGDCPVHGDRRGLLVDNDPDLIPQQLDARAHAGDGESAAIEAGAAARPTWAFTFGCGSPLARYYVPIEADDEMQARCRMVALFSTHWANVYPFDIDFRGQITRYGLRRLDVNKTGSVRLGTNHEEISRDVYSRAFPW